MPKIKTNRAAAKKQRIKEPYLNKEVHKQKENSETGNYYRCNKCKEHEKGFTISVRFES